MKVMRISLMKRTILRLAPDRLSTFSSHNWSLNSLPETFLILFKSMAYPNNVSSPSPSPAAAAFSAGMDESGSME